VVKGFCLSIAGIADWNSDSERSDPILAQFKPELFSSSRKEDAIFSSDTNRASLRSGSALNLFNLNLQSTQNFTDR